MIKFKLLFFILIILFASSCSKEFSDNIVGTWTLESLDISDCPDEGIPALSINATDGCLNLFGDQLCMTLVLNEDNTGSFSIDEDGDPFTTQVTYTADNAAETGSICSQGDCQEITIVNDRLMLSTEEDGCPVFYSFIKS